ncbi:preprotein translocase subunit SecF [Candidatus Pacearchaeota archaeon CG10_big_fil_rev_8_21_14_0_10_35_13]|nr:MAG: preprotein translocase subunit SecF [Candidatus Pacearchaeota archaeon CG10_big_fil_rev_8_21_14_0_10_35_13]
MALRERVLKFHDKYYKHLLFVMIALLVVSLGYLFVFYSNNGDVINKDISLTGGTSITIDFPTDIVALKVFLTNNFDEFSIREISDLRTGQEIAFIVEVRESPEVILPLLEDYLGVSLDDTNSSVEFTGSSLGEGFYNQLRIAIIIAFILMSLVVFFIFKTFVPSMAVVLSAFADIVMTVAVVDFLGISVSSAGIVAFLMLIGYSVDSDILLTTKILKSREGSVNRRLFDAFKTGITMTLTSLVAVVISLLVVSTFSEVLTQIFTVVFIGLLIDIPNTWISNASIIKWYAKKKGL